MPSLNLSGSAISYTYQRLLQTDGVNVYDGTGSLFIIPLTGSFTGSLFGTASYADYSTSASYALTSSYFVGVIDGGTF